MKRKPLALLVALGVGPDNEPPAGLLIGSIANPGFGKHHFKPDHIYEIQKVGDHMEVVDGGQIEAQDAKMHQFYDQMVHKAMDQSMRWFHLALKEEQQRKLAAKE